MVNGMVLVGPVGAGVHFGGDEEVGVEATGYGGGVRDGGPLRHMLTWRL